MTHDSIGLGEDGPTHQAVEKFMLLRATPNILFLRPGDGNETSGAYIAALRQHHRPSVLALSRQGCPNVAGTSIEGVLKGAYVVQDADGGSKPDLILVGTGSELGLCAAAKEKLQGALKVRVVSFPSWELFAEQPRDYQVRDGSCNNVVVVVVVIDKENSFKNFFFSGVGVHHWSACYQRGGGSHQWLEQVCSWFDRHDHLWRIRTSCGAWKSFDLLDEKRFY